MTTEYSQVKQEQKEPTKEIETSEEKPKMEKVIDGKVTKHKKGLMERLVIGMLGPDGLPSITNHVSKEIIMPAIKNIIVDSVTSGVNMFMFGDRGNDSTPRSGGYVGPSSGYRPKTNYGGTYQQKTNYGRPTTHTAPVTKRPRGNHIPDYSLETRNDALVVLDSMIDSARTYGQISVSDYYDLIGVETEFTDNDWGWLAEDLELAVIKPSRGARGFIVSLPPVTKL